MSAPEQICNKLREHIKVMNDAEPIGGLPPWLTGPAITMHKAIECIQQLEAELEHSQNVQREMAVLLDANKAERDRLHQAIVSCPLAEVAAERDSLRQQLRQALLDAGCTEAEANEFAGVNHVPRTGGKSKWIG